MGLRPLYPKEPWATVFRFDMEAKFADVVPIDEVVRYLEGIDSIVYTKHERALDQ